MGAAVLALGLAPASALAAERGWTATVVTGSIEPDRAQVTRPQRRPRITPEQAQISEPVQTSPERSAPNSTASPTVTSATGSTGNTSKAELRPAQQYCVNIADAAADARFAWQKKKIAELEQELNKRIELLEAKTAEYQRWLARRDEFSSKAQQTLVGIYARMRSDAAALQLAAADEEAAAAVLIKLDTRAASAILAEMEPAHAARLAAIMAGAAKIQADKSAKAATDGKKS